MNKIAQKKEILRVINLNIHTTTNKTILRNINFSCHSSEILAILGKNGQGKTTLSLSITNLLNKNVFKVEGKILFDGVDVLNLNEKELISLRQKKIGYIFQNPFASFNPTKTIKTQFEEQSKLKNIPFENFIALMKELSLKDYDQILKKYPYELSGGILQRLSAIRCIASNPLLIIADEPTSALDRPIALELLSLFYHFTKNQNIALILITQDLYILEKYAERVAFLNRGELDHFENKENFFSSFNNNLDLKIFLDAYKSLSYVQTNFTT